MPINKYVVQFERSENYHLYTQINTITACPDPDWPAPKPRPGQIWQVTISRKQADGSYLLLPIKGQQSLINGHGVSKKRKITPHWKRNKKKK